MEWKELDVCAHTRIICTSMKINKITYLHVLLCGGSSHKGNYVYYMHECEYSFVVYIQKVVSEETRAYKATMRQKCIWWKQICWCAFFGVNFVISFCFFFIYFFCLVFPINLTTILFICILWMCAYVLSTLLNNIICRILRIFKFHSFSVFFLFIFIFFACLQWCNAARDSHQQE